MWFCHGFCYALWFVLSGEAAATILLTNRIQPVIPEFNHSHVLPPFLGSDPTVAAEVSPYRTSLSELMKRFAHLQGRRQLLAGLFNYRADLAKLGFVRGFQWLDGSFSEDVETSQNRSPVNIDLVTFVYSPSGMASDDVLKLMNANPTLFVADLAKAAYGCDAFVLPLDKSPENLMKRATYYFNLFSHRRGDHVWKGLLHIPLESDDAVAQELLHNSNSGENNAATA